MNPLKLSNRTYDVLKNLAQIILPALGTLYFTIATIWGLPASEQVVGTIVAVTAFLGVCLGISTNQYQNSDRPYDGVMEISTSEDGMKTYSLQLTGDIDEIPEKDSITFKTKDYVPDELDSH